MFKVGDKVVRKDGWEWGIYGEYRVISGEWTVTSKEEVSLYVDATIGDICYKMLDKNGTSEKTGWKSEDLVLYKEKNDNDKKSFIEVITTIENGQSWADGHLTISKADDKIELSHKYASVAYGENYKEFALQRKEHDFYCAKVAYEQGEIIESCVTGNKYFIEFGHDSKWSRSRKMWLRNGEFEIKEIRGKWYINN